MSQKSKNQYLESCRVRYLSRNRAGRGAMKRRGQRHAGLGAQAHDQSPQRQSQPRQKGQKARLQAHLFRCRKGCHRRDLEARRTALRQTPQTHHPALACKLRAAPRRVFRGDAEQGFAMQRPPARPHHSTPQTRRWRTPWPEQRSHQPPAKNHHRGALRAMGSGPPGVVGSGHRFPRRRQQ